jgi:hypothetical protein
VSDWGQQGLYLRVLVATSSARRSFWIYDFGHIEPKATYMRPCPHCPYWLCVPGSAWCARITAAVARHKLFEIRASYISEARDQRPSFSFREMPGGLKPLAVALYVESSGNCAQ